jgi:hypothetical protein
MINKKQLILVVIVFITSFLVFSAIFSNWEYIKTLFF